MRVRVLSPFGQRPNLNLSVRTYPGRGRARVFTIACHSCNRWFRMREYLIRAAKRQGNRALYCSARCTPSRDRTGKMYQCATCGASFYRQKSAIKNRLANGWSPRYCSLKCNVAIKERRITVTPKIRAKWRNSKTRSRFGDTTPNPNTSRFSPRHGFTGKTIGWWRKFLLLSIGQCEHCGFTFAPILQLHHKDRNRRNNVRRNLLLLCPNCHEKIHYRTRTGKYTVMNWPNSTLAARRALGRA